MGAQPAAENGASEAAVQVLTDRLYADGELGPGYMSRDDCEHLARRVLVALGARVESGWGVRDDATGNVARTYSRGAAVQWIAELAAPSTLMQRTEGHIPTLVGDWAPTIPHASGSD